MRHSGERCTSSWTLGALQSATEVSRDQWVRGFESAGDLGHEEGSHEEGMVDQSDDACLAAMVSAA